MPTSKPRRKRRRQDDLLEHTDRRLDVSRITHGKIQLKRQPTELSSVVSRAVEAIGPLLEGRANKVVVEVPGEGMVISCDPDRLAQAMANLLDNAAKYSERGGTVTVSAGREGDVVWIRIRDGGMGFLLTRWSAFSSLFRRKHVRSSVRAAGWALG